MEDSSNIEPPKPNGLSIKKKAPLFIAVLASLVLMILNAIYAVATEIGVVSTIAFLSSIGVVCGLVLYDNDPSTLRFLKGLFTFLILITVSGVFANYVNGFDLLASLSITSVWSAIFLVAFFRKGFRPRESLAQGTEASGRVSSILKWLAIGLFAALLVLLIFTLYNSRTIDPMIDVWHTIPVAPFLFLILASSSIIISLILLKRGSHLQLLMTAATSALIESLYYLVWYPSLYGDPLVTLGYARYVYRTGSIFDWKYLVSNRQLVSIITGRGFPVFTVQLTRLSGFDIYWVHNVVSPLLWSIIVPVSLYEITCLLVGRNPRSYPKEALLSAFAGALLTPLLIVWGANPTGNTLGFLFLFFSLPLTLRWALLGGRLNWSLAFAAILGSFMTHPMPGIFGAVFLLGAMAFHETTSTREKVMAFALLTLVLPLVLVFAGAKFLPESLVSIPNILSFEKIAVTFSMLLAIAGLFLSLKFSHLNRRIFLLLVGFYLIVMVDFYLSQYGLTSVPYGAERALVIAEFLFVPFIGLLIFNLPKIFDKTNKPMQSVGQGAVRSFSRHLKDPRSVFAVLLILLVSLQAVVSIYQAFPQNEVTIAPSVYEMEAVYYISSTATRRFIVVSDTLFSNIAVGLLGIDWSFIGEYQKGGFGISDWEYPIQKYFLSMVSQPSLGILEDAREYAEADEVYFVISIRNPNFDNVVEKMIEILPVDNIFGGGRLYIFKYPVPIFEGAGPYVTVAYDEGALVEEVESSYTYIIEKNVTYSIEVAGHSTYNLSGYPLYWVFRNLTVNNVRRTFDNSSDVNDFVFVSGLDPADFLKVSWSANNEYPLCGWKEDSFRTGWSPYPKYSYKIDPVINTDNGILSLSGVFAAGSFPENQEDFYYAKQANISTDQYPYAMIRWRSSQRVAVSYIYFEDGTTQEIIPFGSYSESWVISKVELLQGKQIQYVMVGLSDLGGGSGVQGPQTLYVDYILICNGES